ncbi:unnamed protein product [Adineta ricciae]|uniref:Uncharacterized protein n=1 Tax=Adineta ricciae TaxID=249248 RepID=A0A815T007_ADIRI|nr:unnamed protein product [Adineta ricciae]
MTYKCTSKQTSEKERFRYPNSKPNSIPKAKLQSQTHQTQTVWESSAAATPANLNRRTTQSHSASACRRQNATIPCPPDFPNDDYHVDVDNLKVNFMEKLTLPNIADGDHKEFTHDSRDGKHSDSFYDIYPEIEVDGKAFVAEQYSQKSGELKAIDLVRFVNEKYCELNGIDEQVNGGYIRSERSCQLDLRRWGAKFEANAQRPYFEGHERDDVVKHRNDFINYLLEHKDFYHTITDGEAPAWNLPVKSPQRIIICK